MQPSVIKIVQHNKYDGQHNGNYIGLTVNYSYKQTKMNMKVIR